MVCVIIVIVYSKWHHEYLKDCAREMDADMYTPSDFTLMATTYESSFKKMKPAKHLNVNTNKREKIKDKRTSTSGFQTSREIKASLYHFINEKFGELGIKVRPPGQSVSNRSDDTDIITSNCSR